MNEESFNKAIQSILPRLTLPLHHPLFYSQVFTLLSTKKSHSKNILLKILIDDHEKISRLADRSKLQDSCSIRNILRTRQLAKMLINEKGDLNLSLLPSLIQEFQAHLYSLGPHREYDSKRQKHILKVLRLLHEQPNFLKLLKKFTRPSSNQVLEEMIRHTLDLPPLTPITDVHTKQAVLAAWLCYLRQNVGSCFATAPAEIVHDEQPELFLHDLLDLMTMGRLKRILNGVEHVVPLSVSWGGGDLKKPIFIQMTEKGIDPQIWLSPGLVAALEVTKILSKNDPYSKKTSIVKELCIAVIQNMHSSVINAETLIRKILLHSLQISEQQVEDYQNRLQSRIHIQMLTISSSYSPSSAIGERCSNFLDLFEIAKNTFKAWADNALLKVWEFTLASFADIHYEFTHWNLYASLGLKTDEPHGIGQCIYEVIQNKLNQTNEKIQKIQYEYETVFTEVKTVESRIQNASSEKEVQWLRITYQTRMNEFHVLQEQRDEAQKQANQLVQLYENVYKLYLELFKDYFQEVYDADMQAVKTGPFDDSPAGFRLLYKHGRENPVQWTLVQNQYDFIQVLSSFFVATEPVITNTLEGEQIKKDFSELITAIVLHIKTKEFLESAFYRMAIAHKMPLIQNPLDHLDKIEKKPWVYTSGGSMNTLVRAYYCVEGPPVTEEKWVESEVELLVFIADVMKHLNSQLLEPYLKGTRKAFLMESPTHAFLLTPMNSVFKEIWQNESFTYTFIRDRFIVPAQNFVEQIILSQEMINFILNHFALRLSVNIRATFDQISQKIKGPLHSISFRQQFVSLIHPYSILSPDELDSYLYSHLPFFPSYELEERLRQILLLLPGITPSKIGKILEIMNKIPFFPLQNPIMNAQQLQDICKALLCLYELCTTSSEDYHAHVSAAAQQLGFAMPAPIIIADTNWIKNEFGFVVNPGNGNLELWRLNYIGSQGYPMSTWKEWLNGSRPNMNWGIYTKPFQYGQS